VGKRAVLLVTAEGVVTTLLVASAAPPAHQRGCLNALFSPHTLAYADGSNAVVIFLWNDKSTSSEFVAGSSAINL
jgi:hypothetical protein